PIPRSPRDGQQPTDGAEERRRDQNEALLRRQSGGGALYFASAFHRNVRSCSPRSRLSSPRCSWLRLMASSVSIWSSLGAPCFEATVYCRSLMLSFGEKRSTSSPLNRTTITGGRGKES